MMNSISDLMQQVPINKGAAGLAKPKQECLKRHYTSGPYPLVHAGKITLIDINVLAKG